MKTIKIWIKTDKVGSICEDSFEVDDDCSPEEIEEFAREQAFQMMEWGFEEK